MPENNNSDLGLGWSPGDFIGSRESSEPGGRLSIKLDLDMTGFNAGIKEAKKQLAEVVQKYKEALELQHKFKEGETDGSNSEAGDV